jgi:hypothetical protein
MHFINGQLTSVLVDDDPATSNNWSGFFGFEIENTTRFEAKNVYVRKLYEKPRFRRSTARHPDLFLLT